MLNGLFQGASTRKVQHQDCQEDSEALLSPSLATSPPLQNGKRDPHDHEIRVALQTAVLCTAVCLGVGIWLGFLLKGVRFVAGADDFCINHVQQYCKRCFPSTETQVETLTY